MALDGGNIRDERPSSSSESPAGELRDCVKCDSKEARYIVTDKNIPYCRDCYVRTASAAFRSGLGKHRIFKDRNAPDTLILFDGTQNSAFAVGQIQEMTQNNKKGFTPIRPQVLVLISTLDAAASSSILAKRSEFFAALDCRWPYTHVAGILASNDEIADYLSGGDSKSSSSPSIFGSDLLPIWNDHIASISTSSARAEYLSLCKIALALRFAGLMGCQNLIDPSNSDDLAMRAIEALCFGRGGAVSFSTSLLDRRHPKIAVLRPLRDLRAKQIALVNRFLSTDSLVVHIPAAEEAEKRRLVGSIKSLTEDYVHELIDEGFPGTVNAVLSSAAKIRPARRDNDTAACRLCWTRIEMAPEDEEEIPLCSTCRSIADEVQDSDGLKRVLKNCSVV